MLDRLYDKWTPLALLVILTVWKQQNSRIFKREEKDVDSVSAKVHDEAFLWNRAGVKSLAPLVVFFSTSE